MPIQHPTTYSAWIPSHIEWLMQQRSAAPNPTLANQDILMNTCRFLEGTMEYVLRREVRKSLGLDAFDEIPEDKIVGRVHSAFDSEILRSGWADLSKGLFKRAFGHPISKAVGDDLIQSATVVFKLRNSAIAHGRAVNFVSDIDQTDQGFGTPQMEFDWEQKNMQHVADYLSKKGLSDLNLPTYEAGRFFQDLPTDHFHEHAVRFVAELGLYAPVSANLLWIEDESDTMQIVLDQLRGRTMPEAR